MLRQVLAAAVLVSAPCLAAAQAPGKLPRVGVLANTVPLTEMQAGTSSHPAIRAIIDGLRDLGWVNGRNVQLVWRSAEGDLTRLPALADELVREQVDVLVAYGPGIGAAERRTDRIPIVMGASLVTGGDVLDGRVRIESLARPGGNTTGLSLVAGGGLTDKRLSLLKQAAPAIARVALLGFGSRGFSPETEAAARTLGLTLHPFVFDGDVAGLQAEFEAMARKRMDAAIIADHPVTNLRATQAIIHRLAERHRLPVLHEVLSAADSGGLMAYGHDINKVYRRVPYFIDRILRGAKPGDIPIEQAADFELRVNLKAAKAIGLALPPSLLVQADRVIE